MKDSDLRAIALNKAVNIGGSRPKSAEVLTDAKLFYEFLKGDTKDEDKEPKKDSAAPGST